MGEYQNPEISEAAAADEESGVSWAEESVTREPSLTWEPSISEVALGYVQGGLHSWLGRSSLFAQGVGLRGAGMPGGASPYPTSAEPAPRVCVRAGFGSGGA